MNEYAFRHWQRLDFAARRLARNIGAMRADPTLPKLYRDLYESLEERLSAITRSRIQFGHWLRQHPEASAAQVRKALQVLDIPITAPKLRKKIHKIQRRVKARIRAPLR
jgi:hypothetical protein